MGHHNRHFAGDTYARTGIWGPPTSAANFCEEDYAVTRFMAEFVNTLSNLAYVYLAFKYPRCPTKETSKTCLDSLSWSLLLVGVASGAFHATLRQGLQLGDDLSMLLLTGTMLQHLYCRNQAPRPSRLIAAAIWLGTISVSIIYVRSGNLVIHMSAFGTSVALIGLRLLQLIYYPKQKQQFGQRETQAELASRFWTGTAYLAAAFAVWNADLELCLPLRALRQHIGWPWQLLLELHGWWHILTAAGAAHMIQLVRCLCCSEEDDSQLKSGINNKSQLLNDNEGGSSRRQQQSRASPPSSASHRGGGMPRACQADLERIGSSR
ncbi:hypothetical protein E8E14_003632 [Neopestalotiopsis sp. 37M]|nr:hypothetical protein E8E14_003632 [Neopestalotiopsis sp. 37M]